MRKFNCQWSYFNHQTLFSEDAIHLKTEISLQSYLYYGSSNSLNTPHLNRRYFLQKDMDVQIRQVQYAKIYGMWVLKNLRWILEPWKQQQSSGTMPTEKEKQTGCCAEIREVCTKKMYHKSTTNYKTNYIFSSSTLDGLKLCKQPVST